MNPRPILRTPLCDLLGCEYPVVQTAMGWVAGSSLVAATTNAGGFGFLAGATIAPDRGIFLATSRTNELFPAPVANRIVGLIANATRSTPFIILVVAIVPLTRLIAGTSIGARKPEARE